MNFRFVVNVSIEGFEEAVLQAMRDKKGIEDYLAGDPLHNQAPVVVSPLEQNIFEEIASNGDALPRDFAPASAPPAAVTQPCMLPVNAPIPLPIAPAHLPPMVPAAAPLLNVAQ